MKVVLLVTGSIAAYKTPDLVRELKRLGASVKVVMTKAAANFVTPYTLETLSGTAVPVDFFKDDRGFNHIRLAEEADVILVAPASADFIAKVAHGIADEMPSAILLVTRVPVVFAPAMNVHMWEAESTKRNIETLKSRGYRFIEPESGDLACGDVGPGRLSDVDSIASFVLAESPQKILENTRVVVTAGPTQEYLDPLRFISNTSSGKMGFEIARAAIGLGASVTLISGPVKEIKIPLGVKNLKVTSALEMRDALRQTLSSKEPCASRQILFMASAVSDYRASEVSSQKIKSNKTDFFELKLAPNPDILAEICAARGKIEQLSGCPLKVVGFAAESEDLLKSASSKKASKGCDLVVANLVSESIGKDTAKVYLVGQEVTELEVAPKSQLARQILEKVSEM